jgi:hypothetical protein
MCTLTLLNDLALRIKPFPVLAQIVKGFGSSASYTLLISITSKWEAQIAMHNRTAITQ